MTELTVMDSNVVSEAKKYLEATSLPQEALTSALIMVRNHQNLAKLIDHQKKLDPERRKRMVGTQPQKPISDSKLAEIDEFAESNMIPYNCLYITKEGDIAIRAAGWRMRAQADPRILKGFENVIGSMENIDGTDVYTSSGELVFWTGERFPAVGSASSDEPRGSRTPKAHLRMIAETRMQTRAFRLALGLPYEIAEDVAEAEQSGQQPPQPEAEGEVDSAPKLLASARQKYGLDRNAILEILSNEWGTDLKSLGGISDFAQAWDTIEEAMAQTGEQGE